MSGVEYSALVDFLLRQNHHDKPASRRRATPPPAAPPAMAAILVLLVPSPDGPDGEPEVEELAGSTLEELGSLLLYARA
jgi:hypothetical protein